MKLIRDFFTTSDGRVVIAQWPNWPIWIVIIFWTLGFIPHPGIQQLSWWGTRTVLVYWAYLEIRYGVNGWRKLLGWAVLTGIILDLFKIF